MKNKLKGKKKNHHPGYGEKIELKTKKNYLGESNQI